MMAKHLPKKSGRGKESAKKKSGGGKVSAHTGKDCKEQL
jgi:hypothetical protein